MLYLQCKQQSRTSLSYARTTGLCPVVSARVGERKCYQLLPSFPVLRPSDALRAGPVPSTCGPRPAALWTRRLQSRPDRRTVRTCTNLHRHTVTLGRHAVRNIEGISGQCQQGGNRNQKIKIQNRNKFFSSSSFYMNLCKKHYGNQ